MDVHNATLVFDTDRYWLLLTDHWSISVTNKYY